MHGYEAAAPDSLDIDVGVGHDRSGAVPDLVVVFAWSGTF